MDTNDDKLFYFVEKGKVVDSGTHEDLLKKNTRHYAKRQFTWFNNQMKDIEWFKVDYNNFNNTINDIKKYLD